MVNAGSLTSGPTGTGHLIVHSGAAVDLNGQSIANAMSVAGDGISQSGVLYNDAVSTASVAGNISLTADTSIKSHQGGGLHFSGRLSGPHALSITGPDYTFSDPTPFLNTGRLTLGDAATDSVSFAQGVTVTSATSIRVAGSLQSNHAALSLGDTNARPMISLLAATTLNAGTGTITLGGAVSGNHDLQVLGDVVINGGGVDTGSSAQQYSGTISLGTDTILKASAITVGNTISGSGNLTIDADLTLHGADVTTSGTQHYQGAVTVAANNTFTAGAGNSLSDIHFDSTLNGAYAVVINTAGVTTLGGVIGGGTALSSLTTNAGGSLLMNGGAVTTTGAQSYGEAVTLGANTTVNGSAISFASTINGAHSLTINDGGTTTLGGAVGDLTPLTALSIDSASLQLGALNVTGAATLVTGGALQFAELDLGSLSLTTGRLGAGGVSQVAGSTMIVRGNAVFVADTTQAQDALLSSPGNDFRGSVAFRGANQGSWRDVTIVDSQGSLALADVTASGQLNLSAQGAVSFGTTTSVTSLMLQANGDVTQAGPLVVTGTSQIDAGSGAVTLDDAGNDFGGTLALTAASATMVDGTGGLELGSVQITTGDLAVRSNGGPITQASQAAIMVTGDSSFAASVPGTGAADVVLANAGNDFGGTVDLDGATISVVDSNDLQLGNVLATGDLAIAAAADVTMNSAQAGGAVTIDVGNGDLQIGQVQSGGNLAITAIGDVTLNAAQVTGTMNIDTGSGDLTLGQTSVVGDVTIVTQGGDVSQTGEVTLNANVDMNTGSGSITLNNPANDFGGQLVFTSGVTSIASAGDLTLGAIASQGGLTLASQGQLSLSGVTTVQGDLTLSSQGPLTLDHATVDGSMNLSSGGGDVTVGTAQVRDNFTVSSQGGNVALGATGSITTQTGALQVSAGVGNITLSTLNIATDLQLAATSGNISFSSTTVGGNLSAASSSGSITQTAAINVSGAASFDAGSGSVNLSDTGNDFAGLVALSGSSVDIVDSNALTLGVLNISGNLTIQTHGDLVLGSGQVGGTLTADSDNNAITQQAAGLIVTGQTDLTAGTGNITLDAAGNEFANTVNASAVSVELRAASALAIGTLFASDAARLQSGGLLTLGQVTTANDFLASGDGGIVQLAATSLDVGGIASFVATGGDIVLDQPANLFTGVVNIEAQNVDIVTATALMLGTVETQGDLMLETRGGPITQAPAATLIANGKTTLVAKQGGSDAPVTLANTGNNFVGPVAVTAAAVKLRDDVGSLKLGNVRASGMFDAMARGGPMMFEPGTLQMALGGMILTPDPRPSGIDFPKMRPESLASSPSVSVSAVPASSSTSAGRTGLTVMATDQSAGTSMTGSAVIKVSEAPLSQEARNLIPVGKVIALDTSSANNRVIKSASFEIVDGFNSGSATIEMGDNKSFPASVDNNNGKVTLKGDRSVSDYDKALRDIKLRLPADAPPNAVFRIKITLTDQSGKTESKTVTLQVNQPEKVSRNP